MVAGQLPNSAHAIGPAAGGNFRLQERSGSNTVQVENREMSKQPRNCTNTPLGRRIRRTRKRSEAHEGGLSRERSEAKRAQRRATPRPLLPGLSRAIDARGAAAEAGKGTQGGAGLARGGRRGGYSRR